MRPLIVEVPSPLGLRPSGVELAPEVLRQAGLHSLLGCDDARQVAVPPYDARRRLQHNSGPAAGPAPARPLRAGLPGRAGGLPASGLVGYRDFDDNDRFAGEHVRDSGITVRDYRDLRAGTIPQILDGALATVTKPQLRGFWVHFDVDVLDDAIMPAVDYRHEGGLSWDEAAQLLQGLLAQPGACGLEVTIFNPNLDPDRTLARQLCELIGRCVPAAG